MNTYFTNEEDSHLRPEYQWEVETAYSNHTLMFCAERFRVLLHFIMINKARLNEITSPAPGARNSQIRFALLQPRYN